MSKCPRGQEAALCACVLVIYCGVSANYHKVISKSIQLLSALFLIDFILLQLKLSAALPAISAGKADALKPKQTLAPADCNKGIYFWWPHGSSPKNCGELQLHRNKEISSNLNLNMSFQAFFWKMVCLPQVCTYRRKSGIDWVGSSKAGSGFGVVEMLSQKREESWQNIYFQSGFFTEEQMDQTFLLRNDCKVDFFWSSAVALFFCFASGHFRKALVLVRKRYFPCPYLILCHKGECSLWWKSLH